MMGKVLPARALVNGIQEQWILSRVRTPWLLHSVPRFLLLLTDLKLDITKSTKSNVSIGHLMLSE